MEVYKVIGCPCLGVSCYEDAYTMVDSLLEHNSGGYTVAINALKIYKCNKDNGVKQIIENAILQTPDGVAAVYGFRLQYNIKVIKLDLPGLILDIAHKRKASLFILGASEESNQKAYFAISEMYPGIKVCGRENGYFMDIEALRKSLCLLKPDIVLIAMGSPKQEIISADLLKSLPHTLFVGCGGRIDILAGNKKMAPEWIKENGLEWIYRSIKEPKRFLPNCLIFFWIVRKMLGISLKRFLCSDNR